MTFPEQVRYVREKLILSQQMLAKELGVAYATVNRWETGQREPNFKTRRLFHDYCDRNGIKFAE